MVKSRASSHLIGVAALCVLIHNTAFGTTFAPEQDLAAAPAPTMLSDILHVDALGFSCIREEDIDRAFHLSGKGLRLPQTCLPEPCRAALKKTELAGLIGRPPTTAEWDDYYARYAETCRREVVSFVDAAPLPQVTPDVPGDPLLDFWTPLLSSYGQDAPIRAQLRSRSTAVNLPTSTRRSGRRTSAGAAIPTAIPTVAALDAPATTPAPRTASAAPTPAEPTDTTPSVTPLENAAASGPVSAAPPVAALTSGSPTLDEVTQSASGSQEFLPSGRPDIRMVSTQNEELILSTPVPAPLWLMLSAVLGAGLWSRRRH